MTLPDDARFIEDEAALRALHHAPMSRATDKVLRALDRHCLALLAASPFCVLATAGPGGLDASPRGDAPGFLRALDDRTLLLPDRVGNNRLDGMANILADPRVALLVVVPGMDETLRINGTARITDDPRLLAPAAVEGRVPKVGLVIRVEEAFLHCGKAFLRSRLWDPEARVDRKAFPSYPAMLRDHVAGLSDEENERQSAVMAARGLW